MTVYIFYGQAQNVLLLPQIGDFFLLLDTRFIERIESHKLDMNDDTVVLVINEKIYKQKSYLLTFLEKPPRTS